MIDYSKSRVMIIDDTPMNIRVLNDILKKNTIQVQAFVDGEMALEAINENPPDLILLDIMMPKINGYEICERIKSNQSLEDIPVVFISALSGSLDKIKAFEMGGADYITKPFQPDEVVARVKNHLKLYKLQKQYVLYNKQLKESVDEKMIEISDAYKGASLALAKLTESRDYETGQHIRRVQELSQLLAQLLYNSSTFEEPITHDFIQDIYYAASLHDIGKVGIPDDILLKKGSLSKEEFEIIKTHVVIGAETLEEVHSIYANNIISLGMKIARYHHEKYDGTGYMEGLKAEEIPLEARIMTLVDVYDALRSERPYKKAINHNDTCKIIEADIGKHFDPKIGQLFLKNHEKFDEIYCRFSD